MMNIRPMTRSTMSGSLRRKGSRHVLSISASSHPAALQFARDPGDRNGYDSFDYDSYESEAVHHPHREE